MNAPDPAPPAAAVAAVAAVTALRNAAVAAAEPDTPLDALTVRALRAIIAAHKFARGRLPGDVWRHYDFRATGPKRCLAARVAALRLKIRSASLIQRATRGLFARLFVRGRGLARRGMCVNDADVCTLEPIREVPFGLFFGYTDAAGFTYGFNLFSLAALARAAGEDSGPGPEPPVLNPYTRAPIPRCVMRAALTVLRASCLLFARHLPALAPEELCAAAGPRRAPGAGARRAQMSRRMAVLRRRPLEARTRELFAEIDLLGNYTFSAWFESLRAEEYLRLYEILLDIWTRQLDLSSAIRRSICPLGDPFANSVSSEPYDAGEDAVARRICASCVFVAENMVMTGANREYRKLGAIYFLTALTHVSSLARDSMEWFYDVIEWPRDTYV